MNLRRIAMLSASVAALGGIAISAGTALTAQPKPEAATRGAGSLSIRVQDRGAARLLTFSDVNPNNGYHTTTIQEGEGILIRTLQISNGNFAGGGFNEGGFQIALASAGSQPNINFYYPFKDYGTQEFTFDPPVQLNPGDFVAYEFRNATPDAGYLQVQMVGTAPQTVTGFISR